MREFAEHFARVAGSMGRKKNKMSKTPSKDKKKESEGKVGCMFSKINQENPKYLFFIGRKNVESVHVRARVKEKHFFSIASEKKRLVVTCTQPLYFSQWNFFQIKLLTMDTLSKNELYY